MNMNAALKTIRTWSIHRALLGTTYEQTPLEPWSHPLGGVIIIVTYSIRYDPHETQIIYKVFQVPSRLLCVCVLHVHVFIDSVKSTIEVEIYETAGCQ